MQSYDLLSTSFFSTPSTAGLKSVRYRDFYSHQFNLSVHLSGPICLQLNLRLSLFRPLPESLAKQGSEDFSLEGPGIYYIY